MGKMYFGKEVVDLIGKRMNATSINTLHESTGLRCYINLVNGN